MSAAPSTVLLSLLSVSFFAITSCQNTEPTQSDVAMKCSDTLPTPISLPGGTAIIGEDDTLPEEAPQREIKVSAFSIDTTEVTNGQFAQFVNQTGYVTDAEKPQVGFGKPGAAVFDKVSPTNPQSWSFVEGANWRHPEGPSSSIEGQDNYPVVQISYNDAQAYADWAGRALPSAEQWEYAARAGSTTHFVWGEELTPDGEHKANYWQGIFPVMDQGDDGYEGRAPVGCFQPNDFGLYDMIGNVWEWTDSQQTSRQTREEAIYVIKGGSYLCAQNYCRRYRASARQFQEAGFPTNHIGFRTVSKPED